MVAVTVLDANTTRRAAGTQLHACPRRFFFFLACDKLNIKKRLNLKYKPEMVRLRGRTSKQKSKT